MVVSPILVGITLGGVGVSRKGKNTFRQVVDKPIMCGRMRAYKQPPPTTENLDVTH